MKPSRVRPLLAGLSLWTLACASHAQCTPITAVPTAITQSGVYCLTANLTNTAVHAPAINVSASAVRIDFQGYRLQWSGSTSSGNPAVLVGAGLSNVMVRNGLISGFTTAIDSAGAGTVVEDMRLHNNDLGIALRFGGEGSLIRRNSIRLGNGLLVEGANSSSVDPNTGSVRIVDNDIFGPPFTSGGPGYNGMFIQSKNAFVVGNRLGRLYSGIWFDLLTQGGGKYRDNVSVNVTVPYTGGTDIGNNN